jgi:hypothetical protein
MAKKQKCSKATVAHQEAVLPQTPTFAEYERAFLEEVNKPAPKPTTIAELREKIKRTQKCLIFWSERHVEDWQLSRAQRWVEDWWNDARLIEGAPPVPAMSGPIDDLQKALADADVLLRWCDGVAVSSAKLSPRELADKHGVSGEALRKRLDRWRHEHDAGYVEVSNSTPREPKYLYDEAVVVSVIEALKAKPAGQKRAANVQRKKL